MSAFEKEVFKKQKKLNRKAKKAAKLITRAFKMISKNPEIPTTDIFRERLTKPKIGLTASIAQLQLIEKAKTTKGRATA